MVENAPLLELQHITQVYGTGRHLLTAVEDINLTVTEGEYAALVGPSGCGKSTLLRIITGLQQPTGGQVLYRGEPVHGVNPHSTIVFQTFALFPWLTVQQNVEIALKARGIGAKLREQTAEELLDKVGLHGFENAYPRELSGGMRQKVGFARAMAVRPELLCLDEPFSALDVLSAETLRGELLELWLDGKIPTRAILMVTHNIEEAVAMAGRIVVMEQQPGRVLVDLPIDLPYPRLRKDPKVLDFVDKVYGILAGTTQPERVELGSAPGEPGEIRVLPDIHLADLSGLVEHLGAIPDAKEDVYRMAGDLKIDSFHLLKLSEAAELLGLATIKEGDIVLTPLGKQFGEASIQDRIEIFADRLQRLPLVKWLMSMLQASDIHQLEYDVALMALELEFPPLEAEEQLDRIIKWGRYAQLLGYDADSGIIYLGSAD